MNDQQQPAADVLLQHASDAMMKHATEVGSLRGRVIELHQMLGAAYQHIDNTLETGDAQLGLERVMPGYAQWRAAMGTPLKPGAVPQTEEAA